jgi:division protein CdvB (Snf7/Vps24/ESCRT-III family)
LVNRFVNRWKEKEQEPSVVSKIKGIGKPSIDLKQQIIVVTQRIDLQTKTLDNAVRRFQSRDADIFNSVAKALSERDKARANILATELSEIRKVEKMLTHTSLALQSVSMRLNTVTEMGDLITILSPAKSLLSNISQEMSSILPEASQELGNIGSLLSEIVSSTNQSTDMSVDIGKANPEAKEILAEAELLAGKNLEVQLPEPATERSIKKLTNSEAEGQIEYSS